MATPVTNMNGGMELKGSRDDEVTDRYLVTFEQPFDRDNPKDWPERRKWAVTNVLSATGFNRILVSTIMAPALSVIGADLHMSATESALSLSIYLLATAFGPLFIGPLSEVYGRSSILHASNVWFFIFNMVCGFAKTKEVLIASRFLAGFGASAIYSLGAGVLGDVWRPEQRGKSLSLYLLIPLLGAAVGPIVGGFMTKRVTWRWMFWSTSIFQGLMIVFSFLSFRETFGPRILEQRAKRLRKETGASQYQTPEERLHGHLSLFNLVVRALVRPLRLLAFHPIIQVYSLISAFTYGLLYIFLSSFADLWIHHYGQPIEISGLHYIAIALGEIAGSQLCGGLMDYYFQRRQQRSPDVSQAPEARIPLVFPGALIGPMGFLIFGWAANYRVHWIVVDIGIFVGLFGMQLGGMPMNAYVIDAYPDHTSSAMAATQFLRSLTAFLFPLFAPAMYKGLGYGWGNTTLAFAALVIGVPAPAIIWKYGARLRAKAASSF